ncbi:MAG: hypothetical protein P8Q40_07280 [Candidatus Poseidonia sp.]|uniref:hypothetical protein n=1 Tax=Poseidonia sp. TaxID=2666344 RepID=UPI0030C288FF|nr:hypothetical protein [Poseidonia sp.]MDG1552491.1 hypothetical protein [Poseidonia sp.]
MDEDTASAWPEQEEEAESSPDDVIPGDEPQLDAPHDDETQEENDSEATSTKDDKPSTEWSFPVRAAPILALQGERVTEFPLSQHVSGHQSTSLVVDEKLMRMVESRYDSDGVRRLNVRMALVKEHISGYSHTHLDIFQRLMPIWAGSIGFGVFVWLMMSTNLPMIGGGAFILSGLAGILLAKLDLHRISFSDHGGRHDFYLSGWRQNPFLIYNSTALLGPAFVGFLRDGKMDTQHIDVIVESMKQPAQPAPAVVEQKKVQPALAAQPPQGIVQPPLHPALIPAPPQLQSAPVAGPPATLPQGIIPPPPVAAPVPTPLPPPPTPPGPTVVPLNSLPPPPMPLPTSPVGPPVRDPLWD